MCNNCSETNDVFNMICMVSAANLLKSKKFNTVTQKPYCKLAF